MCEPAMSGDGDEALREMEVVEGDRRLVRWERFLPRAALTVLLVEADDSTRQVVETLLRKCSYTVAAVADGLEAWEVLKGRPDSIDLILTEVELPSISGFALLTLIMEHDSCKSIPVIMMSANDSVNMVYKCMLRGAADFLVKPVRKNELQNLWQHVWRRQASVSSGQGLPIKGLNQYNDALTPKNEDCDEKGNGAQSSCSAPELEAESAYTENMQDGSKLKLNKLVGCETDNDVRVSDSGDLNHASVGKGGSSQEAAKDGVVMKLQEDLRRKELQEDCNTFSEASDNNDAIINNGSREARDLIGTFQNRSAKICIDPSRITGITKNDSCSARLDLSLRSYDDSRSHQDITVEETRPVVHQSIASAFSRYKPSQPIIHSTPTSCQPQEYEASIDKRYKHVSTQVQPINYYTSTSCPNTQNSPLYQMSGELRMLTPVQDTSLRLDRTCTSYGSSIHPSYYNQMDASQTPSPESTGQREVLSRVIRAPDHNTSSCSNQTGLRQDINFATAVQINNVSLGNERSQNSNVCNGAINRLNSFASGSACGSNGSGNPSIATQPEQIPMQDENLNRSLLRDAALARFLHKRKDRCFEKKVRYENRKKLAEQRPRVKGQFVRKVPTHVSASSTTSL